MNFDLWNFYIHTVQNPLVIFSAGMVAFASIVNFLFGKIGNWINIKLNGW